MREKPKFGCDTCGTPINYANSLCGRCLETEMIQHCGGIDAFEEAMDDFEERRRERIAERNEY